MTLWPSKSSKSLRSREEFLANQKTLVAPRQREDAVSIVGAYVGAYRTRMSERTSGVELLHELGRVNTIAVPQR